MTMGQDLHNIDVKQVDSCSWKCQMLALGDREIKKMSLLHSLQPITPGLVSDIADVLNRL